MQLLCPASEGSRDTPQLPVGAEGEDAALPPFEELGQRVFHQREGTRFLGDVAEHRGHEARFQRHVDPLRRSRDRSLELIGREWDHRFDARAEQFGEASVQQWPVVEVGSQRDDDTEAAVRVGGGGFEAVEEVRPDVLSFDQGEHLLELVDHEDELRPVGGEQSQHGAMQAVLVTFQLFDQAGRWIRRGPQQGRFQSVERVRAREHVRHMPPSRTLDRSVPKRGDQAGAHDRRLPAPARSDDRQEAGLGQSIDELADKLLTPEEVEGITFLERTQSLVWVRDRRARNDRCEADDRGAERPSERLVLRRVVRLRLQSHDVDRLCDPLQPDGSLIDVRDPFHFPGEMNDLAAREDLGRTRDRAEPRPQVERSAAVSTLDGHGLACVHADPDRERKGWGCHRLLDEPPLQLDRCPDRLPRRREEAEGSIAHQLMQRPPRATRRFHERCPRTC